MAEKPRTDYEVLINQPVTIKLSDKTGEVHTFTISEPSIDEFDKHCGLIVHGFSELYKSNSVAALTLVKNLAASDDFALTIAPYVSVFKVLTADVLGKDAEWIGAMLTKRQQLAVLEAYVSVIGIEAIAGFFSKMVDQIKREKSGVKLPTPPFVEQSPESAGNTESSPPDDSVN